METRNEESKSSTASRSSQDNLPESVRVDMEKRHADEQTVNNAMALATVPVASVEVAKVLTREADVPVTEPTQDDEKQYVSGTKLLAACVALNVTFFLIMLDGSILSTATPRITDEFHSTKDIGWYVSSYQLAQSSLQPTTGKLFTHLSNKWTYITSLFIFELGSLICALANSSGMLIGGRTIAGLGAAGMFNGALTIIAALVPLKKRPAITGTMIGLGQLGTLGGPLIGGSLTQYTTWRWCFWINLPIGGLAMILLAAVHIPEQTPKPPLREFLRTPNLARKFDLAGAALMIPSVVMLLLALTFGGSTHPWSSPTTIGLFCGGGLTAALFLTWEHLCARDDAMLPLRMFASRVVAASAVLNVCVFTCTFVAAYFLPVYFQSVQGVAPLTSGVHLLPSVISQILAAVLSGIAVGKMGYYLPWAVAGTALMSVGAGLVTTWSATTGRGVWIGCQVVLGAGRGSVMQMGLLAVQAVLPGSQIAVAMAVLGFVQGLGVAVFMTVANTIFDNSVVEEILARAPGVDPRVVLGAGATTFRDVVPTDQLSSVLEAWAVGVDNVFYMVVGLSVLAFVAAWSLGWHDVRKKQVPQMPQEVSSGEKKRAESTEVNV